MKRVLLVAIATSVAVVVLWWSLLRWGASSAAFAFVVVWAPMAWLGTISRVLPPRLPRGWYRLRPWERDGRVYERLGVPWAKRLLRRGPLAWFNPGLHLPEQRSAEQLRRLERGMEVAEASHALLAAATLVVVLHAAARGWWLAAALTLVFDLLMNGYPVMLQRYNRSLLHARYPGL